MTRTVTAIVIAASLCLIAWSGLRLQQARADAESTAHRLRAAQEIAQQVIDLRARSERVSMGARPEQDTTARVLAAIADAGMPRAAFKSLSPEADTPITRGGSGATYYRQSFRVTLAPLNARQLGAFLEAWREGQQIWTVERIEITHVAAGRGRGADEDLYNARLTIAATYIADPKEGA